MNLGNYKISTKILSVIVLLGLVAVAITATGVLSLQKLNTATDKMEISTREAILGARMRQNIIAMNRSEFRLAADPSPENVAETLKIIDKQVTEFEGRWDEAYSTAGEKRKLILDELKKQYVLYKKELDITAELAKRYSSSIILGEEQKHLVSEAMNSRNVSTAFEEAAVKYVELVYSQAQTESDEAGKTYEFSSLLMIVGALAGIVVGLFLGMMIARRGIVQPMRNIVGCLSHLAEGNLQTDVYGTERKDEVGEIAKTTLVFKQNMIKAKELEEAQRQEEIAKQKRQVNVDAAINKFQLSMGDIVKFVASASTELQVSAQSLSASAEETSKQSGAVAAASQQAAANVQTVASATEELSSSINEISSQVSRSSAVAAKAVQDAQLAGQSVAELVEAAQKIGEVTSIISGIAEQTNLLALNATIEAARAGDAGKGFAVVASEVKNLANEATKATEEISSQIAQIQTISKTSAEAINMICKVIGDMDAISGTISAAIQEQTSATQEISRNVGEAYTGTSEVTQNIASVSDAANDTGSASHQVLSAADELSRQSEVLREEFDTFLKELEAA